MCDFLTNAPGSSDFPEEQEPWKEVDPTDVELEQKMKGLKMEQEADFSEPEQVKLVQPVVASNPAPALPTSASSPASTSSPVVADKRAFRQANGKSSAIWS